MTNVTSTGEILANLYRAGNAAQAEKLALIIADWKCPECGSTEVPTLWNNNPQQEVNLACVPCNSDKGMDPNPIQWKA